MSCWHRYLLKAINNHLAALLVLLQTDVDTLWSVKAQL